MAIRGKSSFGTMIERLNSEIFKKPLYKKSLGKIATIGKFRNISMKVGEFMFLIDFRSIH